MRLGVQGSGFSIQDSGSDAGCRLKEVDARFRKVQSSRYRVGKGNASRVQVSGSRAKKVDDQSRVLTGTLASRAASRT